jgi:hypothetical protein
MSQKMKNIPKPTGIPFQRTMGTLVMLAVLLNLTLRNLSLLLVPMGCATTTSLTAGNEHSSKNVSLMERWLRHEEGGGGSTPLQQQQQCDLLPRRVNPGYWFSNVTPDAQPEFSLLSAWLKPEYPSGVSASEEIPKMHMDGFTMGGQIKLRNDYHNQVYLGGTAETSTWTKTMIDERIEEAKQKVPMKYRADGLKIHDGMERYNSSINGQRGIVIGSEDPWVEAILLSHGAGRLLTLEFGSINCTHPQVNTILPGKFTERFLNGQMEPFDFGISFSSLEHDGLGRYGDILNPIGDLQTMAKMLSVIKPGGLFFVAVPVDAEDKLVFNAHRVYGPLRLPKFFAGWSFIDIVHNPKQNKRRIIQDLFVLQNLNGCLNKV